MTRQPSNPSDERSLLSRFKVLQFEELTSSKTQRSQLLENMWSQVPGAPGSYYPALGYALTVNSKLHDQDVKSGLLIHDIAGDFLLFHCGNKFWTLSIKEPGHPHLDGAFRIHVVLACTASLCSQTLLPQRLGLGQSPLMPSGAPQDPQEKMLRG